MAEIAPKMHVIDLDNTTYQTDPAFDKMVDLVVANGLASREVIGEARAEVEAGDDSFDLLTHLVEKLDVPQAEVDGVAAEFGANRAGDDFLFPDAYDSFIALIDTSTPNFIFTKGGLQTQTAKLRSTDLYDHWHEITDRTDKAGAMETLKTPKTPEGYYAVEVSVGETERELLVAQRALIEEDKIKGFDGLAAGNGGWLVDRFGKYSRREIAVLPPSVKYVQDLTLVTEHIYDSAARRYNI